MLELGEDEKTESTEAVEQQEPAETPEVAATEEEGAQEVVITIGEEPLTDPKTTEPAPAWARDLRRANREKEKRIKELEAKLSQTAENKPVVVGDMPKLESFDYDENKYASAVSEWTKRKMEADRAEEAAKTEERAKQNAWADTLNSYVKAKGDLEVPDYEDAESVIETTLNVTQQGIILQGAENPALVVYALGKNPAKASEMAAIKDPVKFAFAVAKLEKELKIMKKTKPSTQPEKTIQGSPGVKGTVDSTLERLRAEAEKTGNFTKLLAYKKQKQATKT